MLMMDYLGLIDSSRKLVFIYSISFIISLYLIFLIGVQTSDVTGLKLVTGSKHDPYSNVWFEYLAVELNFIYGVECLKKDRLISLLWTNSKARL
jgi:hypothetical protein